MSKPRWAEDTFHLQVAIPVSGNTLGPFGVCEYAEAWTLTHIPTGLRVAKFATRAAAMRAGRKLWEMDIDWNVKKPVVEGLARSAVKAIVSKAGGYDSGIVGGA